MIESKNDASRNLEKALQVDSTDWNSMENAKMWRKDNAETVESRDAVFAVRL